MTNILHIPLFGKHYYFLDLQEEMGKKMAWDNHDRIIIRLQLLFYPHSPVDVPNGITSLCRSKSHFCPPRPRFHWQSARTNEGKKRERKEPTEAFFYPAFCQFLCACQNEIQCLVARLVEELLGRGWSWSAGQVVKMSRWRATSCCYKAEMQ